MPTVSVIKDELERLVGVTHTNEEWKNIFLKFGLEVDRIAEEAERKTEEVVTVYKIDIGANRADLLCCEGIARAIKTYLGKSEPLFMKHSQAPTITMTVHPSTAQVRPYVVSCVIHNITFTQRSYNSFIDHQDKLHHNVCRRRTLVAIGTHDLAKIEGPFTYTAEAPEDISFVALDRTEETNGRELFEYYHREHSHLKDFLQILDDEELWPVIRDGRGRVMSLPPIINSEFSKMSIETKNVFVESTATDLTKAYIALAALINGITVHSTTPCEVEPVTVHYMQAPPLLTGEGVSLGEPTDDVTPHVNPTEMVASVSRINRVLGTSIPGPEIPTLLKKMGLIAAYDGEDKVVCQLPATRSDILHPIDIAEDVGVAYGFERINQDLSCPPPTVTQGGVLPIHKASELIRAEAAACGYTETLSFSLCPVSDEVFAPHVVHLANSKTESFKRVRSSLIPGLLRSLAANLSQPLPLSIFEVSEVVHASPTSDTGSMTERYFSALRAGKTDGFGHIHGLIDHLMMRHGISEDSYKLVGRDMAYCMEGRRADLVVNGEVVGWAGVIHPDVLKQFHIPFPCSVVEFSMNKTVV
eukprot:gnl/Dysnectes_brevis/226_a257_3319.p1 GENE.gnl/Dysnectes_brevis/226_a257_3319~~gnl/Dysnectes_brevis/226_a257_3319.p1  ORF type:complete len:585 (+),score=239.54 gnl/Dysnectes_brevis/226_a257_3319:1336-3090(+)